MDWEKLEDELNHGAEEQMQLREPDHWWDIQITDAGLLTVVLLGWLILVLPTLIWLDQRGQHQRQQHAQSQVTTFLASQGLTPEGPVRCQFIDGVFECGVFIAPDHRVLTLRCTAHECMPRAVTLP
jgi:hypothetical protein